MAVPSRGPDVPQYRQRSPRTVTPTNTGSEMHIIKTLHRLRPQVPNGVSPPLGFLVNLRMDSSWFNYWPTMSCSDTEVYDFPYVNDCGFICSVRQQFSREQIEFPGEEITTDLFAYESSSFPIHTPHQTGWEAPVNVDPSTKLWSSTAESELTFVSPVQNFSSITMVSPLADKFTLAI